MSKIRWEGYFRAHKADGFGARMRARVTDFLTQANLVCPNMGIIAYEYDSGWSRSKEKIHLVEVPGHCNHADLVIIGPDLFDSGLRVRVMWHCNNLFPSVMGIPTWKRLRNAVNEYNKTGVVKTKMDDLKKVSARDASMELSVQAIMREGKVIPQGVY